MTMNRVHDNEFWTEKALCRIAPEWALSTGKSRIGTPESVPTDPALNASLLHCGLQMPAIESTPPIGLLPIRMGTGKYPILRLRVTGFLYRGECQFSAAYLFCDPSCLPGSIISVSETR
jgi:hypothetical protein